MSLVPHGRPKVTKEIPFSINHFVRGSPAKVEVSTKPSTSAPSFSRCSWVISSSGLVAVNNSTRSPCLSACSVRACRNRSSTDPEMPSIIGSRRMPMVELRRVRSRRADACGR
nr:hypothetical protein BJQ95_01802 [Cryobacterium sp. SO1]